MLTVYCCRSSRRGCYMRKMFIKIVKFHRKHQCWSLFSIKLQVFRSDSKTGFVLWNLQNISEHLSWRILWTTTLLLLVWIVFFQNHSELFPALFAFSQVSLISQWIMTITLSSSRHTTSFQRLYWVNIVNNTDFLQILWHDKLLLLEAVVQMCSVKKVFL